MHCVALSCSCMMRAVLNVLSRLSCLYNQRLAGLRLRHIVALERSSESGKRPPSAQSAFPRTSHAFSNSAGPGAQLGRQLVGERSAVIARAVFARRIHLAESCPPCSYFRPLLLPQLLSPNAWSDLCRENRRAKPNWIVGGPQVPDKQTAASEIERNLVGH